MVRAWEGRRTFTMNSRILVLGTRSARWGGTRRIWSSWRQFVLSCRKEGRKTSEALHRNHRKFSISSLRIRWLNCKRESSGPNPLNTSLGKGFGNITDFQSSIPKACQHHSSYKIMCMVTLVKPVSLPDICQIFARYFKKQVEIVLWMCYWQRLLSPMAHNNLCPKDPLTLLLQRFSNYGLKEDGTQKDHVSISMSQYVRNWGLPLLLIAMAVLGKWTRFGKLVLSLQTSWLDIWHSFHNVLQ